mmetsp:Transcript_15066/g.40443  ORF Transcript_15066/g.40443 Transcript_15066/m.40443 type:complete len:200 (-) Transcript_15066:280-879(-)
MTTTPTGLTCRRRSSMRIRPTWAASRGIATRAHPQTTPRCGRPWPPSILRTRPCPSTCPSVGLTSTPTRASSTFPASWAGPCVTTARARSRGLSVAPLRMMSPTPVAARPARASSRSTCPTAPTTSRPTTTSSATSHATRRAGPSSTQAAAATSTRTARACRRRPSCGRAASASSSSRTGSAPTSTSRSASAAATRGRA